jgi:copper chaperone NosL
LGYKQLLNFGAYSIPDIGGWMLIAGGFLLFILVVKESHLWQRLRKPKMTATFLVILSFSFFSCNNAQAVPIKLNKDNCDFCKMSISDGKYGAEVITEKGRVYKFDDIGCMANYCKENSNTKMKAYYVHNYTRDNILIPAKTAFFISGGAIHSPMGGNIIGFSSEKEAKLFNVKLNSKRITWDAIVAK